MRPPRKAFGKSGGRQAGESPDLRLQQREDMQKVLRALRAAAVQRSEVR